MSRPVRRQSQAYTLASLPFWLQALTRGGLLLLLLWDWPGVCLAAVFEAMDRRDRGAVSYRTVFFELARIAHGTSEEKAAFLFMMLSDDDGEALDASSLLRFIVLSAENAGASSEHRDALIAKLAQYSVSASILCSCFVWFCLSVASLHLNSPAHFSHYEWYPGCAGNCDEGSFHAGLFREQ